MDIFRSEFSKEFTSYNVVMAMDNASWHSCRRAASNTVPLFQPAYSSEVNPANMFGSM
jgi:hypothetical protein